ncbi:MAG: hypothetical protein ACKO2G_16360 [Verrucomicrobiales bacterium]
MTLIEVSIALMIAMVLAVASMAMLSQQLSFTRMVQNQIFLLEDCPSINNTLSRMLGRVDSYRIYPTVAGAKAGGAGVITGGKAIVLSCSDSLERVSRSIVAAEADFYVENGVLRIRLTGPNNEEITYSGHTQS